MIINLIITDEKHVKKKKRQGQKRERITGNEEKPVSPDASV